MNFNDYKEHIRQKIERLHVSLQNAVEQRQYETAIKILINIKANQEILKDLD